MEIVLQASSKEDLPEPLVKESLDVEPDLTVVRDPDHPFRLIIEYVMSSPWIEVIEWLRTSLIRARRKHGWELFIVKLRIPPWYTVLLPLNTGLDSLILPILSLLRSSWNQNLVHCPRNLCSTSCTRRCESCAMTVRHAWAWFTNSHLYSSAPRTLVSLPLDRPSKWLCQHAAWA